MSRKIKEEGKDRKKPGLPRSIKFSLLTAQTGRRNRHATEKPMRGNGRLRSREGL